MGIFFYICRFLGCVVDVMRLGLRLLSIFLVVLCVFQTPFSVFAMEDQTIQDESSIELSSSEEGCIPIILFIVGTILVALGVGVTTAILVEESTPKPTPKSS